jgi:thiol-disulfide isomerase/thioredoxin
MQSMTFSSCLINSEKAKGKAKPTSRTNNGPGYVIPMTDSNFERVMQNDKCKSHSLRVYLSSGYFVIIVCLILLWSPHCHWCHEMIPEFKAAAKKTGSRILFGSLNVQENRRTKNYFDIQVSIGICVVLL